MKAMKDEGIHRVSVPGTAGTAVLIVAMIAGLLVQWPWLTPVALATLGLGFLVGVGLILKRRRSGGAPPAARLNFPLDRE